MTQILTTFKNERKFLISGFSAIFQPVVTNKFKIFLILQFLRKQEMGKQNKYESITTQEITLKKLFNGCVIRT